MLSEQAISYISLRFVQEGLSSLLAKLSTKNSLKHSGILDANKALTDTDPNCGSVDQSPQWYPLLLKMGQKIR